MEIHSKNCYLKDHRGENDVTDSSTLLYYFRLLDLNVIASCSNPGKIALPLVRAGDGDATTLASHTRREPAAPQC